MTVPLADALILALPVAALAAVILEMLAADPAMLAEVARDADAFARAPLPAGREPVEAGELVAAAG